MLLVKDDQWAYLSGSEQIFVEPLADRVEYVTNLGESLFAINVRPRSDEPVEADGRSYGYVPHFPDLVYDPFDLWKPPPGVVPHDFLYEDRILVSRDGKFGFANRKGEIVIDTVYEFAKHFSDGLAPVLRGGEWGYIDCQGKMNIKPQYLRAHPFDDGVALVLTYSNNEYVLINSTGQVVRQMPDNAASLLSEGLALNKTEGRFGYVNAEAEWEIAPVYEWGSAFVDGQAFVVHTDPHKSGVIDRSGELEIAVPHLAKPTYFRGGLAWVELTDETQGYINRQGEWTWKGK